MIQLLYYVWENAGGGDRDEVASPHPPDPAQTKLPQDKDRTAPPAFGCRSDQELGLRPASQRPSPRGFRVGNARDRQGRRGRLGLRGTIRRGPLRRTDRVLLQCGARGGLSRGRQESARSPRRSKARKGNRR